LVDGYPAVLVWQFIEAANLNRRREAMERAVAVSLGISDAFAKAELAGKWLELNRDAPAAAAEPGKLNPALAWFARQPRIPNPKRQRKTEN
jgi:hypothetical protein